MKNTFYFTLILSACLIFAGCQKEYNLDDEITPPGGTNPGVTGNFTAKINGVQFTADKGAAAVRAGGIISIAGLANDGTTIAITLTDSGVHVYQLRQNMNAGAYNESASSISFTSNATGDPALAGGTLTIASIDTTAKKMSGSFAFRVYRETDSTTRNITEGSFSNISYTKDNVQPTNNLTDTFRVKLDGVDWVNYSLNALSVPGFNKIGITSSNSSTANVSIGFQLDNSIAPGSYVWDFFSVTGLYNPPTFATTGSLLADGGNLLILENNPLTKRIRGSFNFVAKPLTAPTPAVTFTQGYFSVVYQ